MCIENVRVREFESKVVFAIDLRPCERRTTKEEFEGMRAYRMLTAIELWREIVKFL